MKQVLGISTVSDLMACDCPERGSHLHLIGTDLDRVAPVGPRVVRLPRRDPANDLDAGQD